MAPTGPADDHQVQRGVPNIPARTVSPPLPAGTNGEERGIVDSSFRLGRIAGDLAWATNVAASIGRGFGCLLIAGGIALFVFRPMAPGAEPRVVGAGRPA
jgi:hypothetical protein